jgi:hypothetical protein
MNRKIVLSVSALFLFACVSTSTPPTATPYIETSSAPVEAETAVPADTVVPPMPGGDVPVIANCPMFPANNIWNARVDSLPIHPMSKAWIDNIGRDEGFHMDFGSGEWDGGPIGIPYNVVSGSSVTKYTLDFYYPDESDAGPYPLSPDPLIEYGSDHHILVLDTDDCRLYEIYDASFENGNWSGGSGAIWDLNSNALRPDTWTSADAAGLPILPGLVRYDEIAAGEIKHALRFTVEETAGYIWPARHLTSEPQEGVPPMGSRFRLKADYDENLWDHTRRQWLELVRQRRARRTLGQRHAPPTRRADRKRFRSGGYVRAHG